MPGGRHIYLRAASTAERQQWLLALGVAKQEENVMDSGKKQSVTREGGGEKEREREEGGRDPKYLTPEALPGGML